MNKDNMKTLTVDISDNNSHHGILVSIIEQLQMVGWASRDETQTEWTTILDCMRDYPDTWREEQKKCDCGNRISPLSKHIICDKCWDAACSR